MAEKRYYWMRLDYRRFESGGDMDFLMSQKDGANYVVLYQMLVLNTRNTGGEMIKQLGEIIIPFDIDAIVRDCKYFSKDTVIVALELYKQLGMIYENKDGYLQLAGFDSLIGAEYGSAKRMRDKRARDKAIAQDETTIASQCDGQCDKNVTTDIRDKRKDIRDKDKKIKDSNYSSADTSSFEAEPPAQKEKVFIQFPVIGSSEPADVYESYVESLIPIYPAIDVKGEIRRAKAWCEANPANRKTQAGLKRFLINWLNKAQNNAPRVNNSNNNRRGFGSATNEEIERANEEIRLHGSKDGWIYCNMDEE